MFPFSGLTQFKDQIIIFITKHALCLNFRLSGGTLDSSLSDLVKELGYIFTSTLEECRNSVIKLGGRDIAPSTVARVLAVMCRTHTGLDDALGNFFI